MWSLWKFSCHVYVNIQVIWLICMSWLWKHFLTPCIHEYTLNKSDTFMLCLLFMRCWSEFWRSKLEVLKYELCGFLIIVIILKVVLKFLGIGLMHQWVRFILSSSEQDCMLPHLTFRIFLIFMWSLWKYIFMPCVCKYTSNMNV